MLTNIPFQTTTFVGREVEVGEIRRHLTTDRLVTLTGSGGCGKTRLAQESVVQLGDDFPDGVWWVDLARLAQAEFVTASVASVLLVREIPGQPLVETLVKFLRVRRALILLDNCEHLIGACAELGEQILRSTPRVKIIATSRAPLGISGEILYRIPSLTLPPEPFEDSATSLSDYEAADLFIDRARRARPTFEVSDENAPAIAQICTRLDGIPLAIELAAARSSVLAPHQIAQGLGDLFRLVSGGARTALPRQRTLEASVTWSHELLGDPERVMFRRLSVFAGGFTYDAIGSVCSWDGIQPAEILDLLTSLVEKSLVQADEGGSLTRYRLLETIREFAAQKLQEAGEYGSARLHHMRFFVQLAERAGPDLEGHGFPQQVTLLDPELDNIRAALEWSLEQSDGSDGLRALAALRPYWEARAVSEGLERFRAALARDSEDLIARSGVLLAAGLLSLTLGDPGSVLGYTDEAVAISRACEHPKSLGRALAFAGLSRNFLDPRNSRPYLEESEKVAREVKDLYGLGEALVGLGFRDLSEGNLSPGLAWIEEAVAVAAQTGSPVLIARAGLFHGWILHLMTNIGGAREALARSTGAASAVQAQFWVNFGTHIRAVGTLLAGSTDESRSQLGASVDEAREIMSAFGIAIGLWGLGQACRASGETDATVAVLTEGVMFQRMTSFRWLEAWSLATLAELAVERADAPAARGYLDEAAQAVEAERNIICEGRILLARAALAASEEELEAAEKAQLSALGLFQEAGHLQGVVEAIERLAAVFVRSEYLTQATTLLGAADAMRRALGYQRFPIDRAAYDDVSGRCRDALGDDGFDSAVNAGAAMPLHEVVGYANRDKGKRKRPALGWSSLTPAESDVIGLVAKGLTNAEIGKRLFISPRTVQAHLARVFGRLGVSSRTELAKEAIKRGAGADEGP